MPTVARNVVKVEPCGTVIEVLSDAAALLVKTDIVFERWNESGTARETYTETHVVPALIGYRGTKSVKEYFCYEEGEKVIVIAGSDKLSDEALDFWSNLYTEHGFLMYPCFVVGSYYDYNDRLPAKYEKVRMIDFGCGSIEVNLEDKSLNIEFEGEITINGREIYLNG